MATEAELSFRLVSARECVEMAIGHAREAGITGDLMDCLTEAMECLTPSERKAEG